jgi:hypothetical protein
MLEHARHRFLASAAAVVNADIDEFPITTDRSSIFDLVRGSRTGYLRYSGRWIENASSVSPGVERRHKNYVYFLADSSSKSKWGQPKWAVVPSRCPAAAWWRVHRIDGVEPDVEVSGKILFRHFKAINTNWKESRWRNELSVGPEYVVDEELKDCLRVFEAG